MIVMFRGTNISKNLAPQILSLYATINAVKYNRKTLVIQFMKSFPVEKILKGKQEAETEVKERNRYQFNDTGIDAILRKIENQKIEQETFDLACTAMLKSDNLLDVLGTSGKDDFLKEIVTRTDHIKKLVEYGVDMYDDVYILGDGKNIELMKLLNPLVDISIICIPQGNKEEIKEITTESGSDETAKTNDFLLMVADFDKRSSFDVPRMKKIYDVKRIALCPYNTGFKDAYNSNNVLSFVLSNVEVEKHDANFELFNYVFDVHKQIMKNEEPEEENFDFKKLERTADDDIYIPEKRELTAKNVRYTKKYKKFLFWKKEENSYEVTMDDFEDEKDNPLADYPGDGQEYDNDDEEGISFIEEDEYDDEPYDSFDDDEEFDEIPYDEGHSDPNETDDDEGGIPDEFEAEDEPEEPDETEIEVKEPEEGLPKKKAREKKSVKKPNLQKPVKSQKQPNAKFGLKKQKRSAKPGK